MRPCHACNGSHFIKDCNESIYNRCNPNLDNHTPAKCPRKRPLKRQQKSNPSYNNNNNSIRNQSNGHNDPNLQLPVSTSTLCHISEFLEATRKMIRYLNKSYKQNKTTIVTLTVTTPVQTTTMQLTQTNTNVGHIT